MKKLTFAAMKLTEVTDKRLAKRFLDVARVIYKDDPYWICPLDREIEKIFNKKLNKSHEKGDSIRWILTDDRGNLIGRIGAFYNLDRAARFPQPTGGIGFFECIDNKEAAFMLFDKAKEWLEGHGMQAMDGQVNFGENDMYWGLLVEGFEHRPAYGVNYNKAYYVDFFESYGFYNYFEQTTKHLDMTIPFPERFWTIARWVMKKPGYSFRHLTFKKAQKFAEDLVKVYNEAWVHHEHFVPLKVESVMNTFHSSKAVLEEKLIWFAYHEDEPIGFIVMIPDINLVLRHLNGKLNLSGILKFLYFKRTVKMDRGRITILGTSPKFQNSGIESCLFYVLNSGVKQMKTHVNEIEISWVGDFNPKMQALLEATQAKPAKKHITYRKLFDAEAEARRAAQITRMKERT